jgi:hypothetical protein
MNASCEVGLNVLVLQAHNHNYQRTYLLQYNKAVPSDPIITDKRTRDYKSDLKGPIFIAVGTAGQDLYNLTGEMPSLSSNNSCVMTFSMLKLLIMEKT